MAQNIDISVILKAPPTSIALAALLEALIDALKELFGKPEFIARQSVTSQAFERLSWSEERHLLHHKLDPDQLIHVYGKSYGSARASVTIEETFAVTTYTVALPTIALINIGESSFISILQNIYELFSASAPTLLLAGVESMIDSTVGDLSALAQTYMTEDLDLLFAAGSTNILSSWSAQWSEVRRSNDFRVLMRVGSKMPGGGVKRS